MRFATTRRFVPRSEAEPSEDEQGALDPCRPRRLVPRSEAQPSEVEHGAPPRRRSELSPGDRARLSALARRAGAGPGPLARLAGAGRAAARRAWAPDPLRRGARLRPRRARACRGLGLDLGCYPSLPARPP